MRTLGVLLEAAGNAAAALLILAACCSLGHVLVPVRLQPPRRVHRLFVGLSAGALAVGWVTWLAGSISTRLIAPLAVLLVLGAAFGARRSVASARAAGRYLAALARANLPATVLLAALLLVLAPSLCVPPVDSDGLRNHLALPKLYLLSGRIFDDRVSWGASFPQGADMLYLLGLGLGAGGGHAKLLHAGFFLAALAALACTVHHGRRTRPAALLAAAFLAASPVALAPAGAAFVDHAALFHVNTALLLLAFRSRSLLVGVAAAGALFTKITTAPVAAGCWLLAPAAARGHRMRALALAVAPAIVALAPLAIRNLAATGDPFFPVGHVLLGRPTPGISAQAITWTMSFHAASPAPLGIAWWPDPGRVPPDEVSGWHLFLGVLASAVAVFAPRARIFLLPVLAYALLGAWLRPPTRYLLPLLAALAALLAFAAAAIHRNAARLASLLALPAAYLAAHCLLTSFRPLDLVLGRADRRTYLARTVPGYEAALVLNAQPRRGRVMALDFPAVFYLDRPWIAECQTCDPPLLAWLQEARDVGELLARLRSQDVASILVPPSVGGGGPESLLLLAQSPREAAILRDLRASLRLVATAGGVDVYEVPLASPPAPPYPDR